MNIKDYSAELWQLHQATPANLANLGQWTQNVALPWLWDELGGAILKPKPTHEMARTPPSKSTLNPLNAPDAIRHGLTTSVADQQKKPSVPSYYQAQLTMLDSEARRYCASIDSFGKAQNPFAADAVVHTLHRALLDMMGLAVVLLEDAAREVTEVPGYFAAWRRQHEHPFEVFKGAEQVIYGTYSGMTHVDRAPYIPVAVLRTAIELRLRHIFCIYSLEDLSNPDAMAPIDMSRLFEAMRERQSEIDFVVDMHDIWKIYRWSNFYLHGGVRDFPWVAGFLLQYLRPLFADPRKGPNGSWNINGGVRMKRETWHAVRAALQPSLDRPSLKFRIANAWRTLMVGKPRQLKLPAFDEEQAMCVFLD